MRGQRNLEDESHARIWLVLGEIDREALPKDAAGHCYKVSVVGDLNGILQAISLGLTYQIAREDESYTLLTNTDNANVMCHFKPWNEDF